MNIPDTVKSAFPNEIDLGKSPGENDSPLATTKEPGKQKKFFPSLYISDVEGLADLPSKGYALIYYERRSATTTKRDETETHSAELEVQEICLPSAAEGGGEDLEDAFSKFAKKKGVATGEEGDEEVADAEPDDTEEEA